MRARRKKRSSRTGDHSIFYVAEACEEEVVRIDVGGGKDIGGTYRSMRQRRKKKRTEWGIEFRAVAYLVYISLSVTRRSAKKRGHPTWGSGLLALCIAGAVWGIGRLTLAPPDPPAFTALDSALGLCLACSIPSPSIRTFESPRYSPLPTSDYRSTYTTCWSYHSPSHVRRLAYLCPAALYCFSFSRAKLNGTNCCVAHHHQRHVPRTRSAQKPRR